MHRIYCKIRWKIAKNDSHKKIPIFWAKYFWIKGDFLWLTFDCLLGGGVIRSLFNLSQTLSSSIILCFPLILEDAFLGICFWIFFGDWFIIPLSWHTDTSGEWFMLFLILILILILKFRLFHFRFLNLNVLNFYFFIWRHLYLWDLGENTLIVWGKFFVNSVINHLD